MTFIFWYHHKLSVLHVSNLKKKSYTYTLEINDIIYNARHKTCRKKHYQDTIVELSTVCNRCDSLGKSMRWGFGFPEKYAITTEFLHHFKHNRSNKKVRGYDNWNRTITKKTKYSTAKISRKSVNLVTVPVICILWINEIHWTQ